MDQGFLSTELVLRIFNVRVLHAHGQPQNQLLPLCAKEEAPRLL